MDKVAESIFQECISANKSCGVFEHPNCGIIEVRGKDRVSFLHNVLSNDIKSLNPGHGTAACILNAQARIVVASNVFCFDSHFWITCSYLLKDRALDHLSKLIIMEDVELVDHSEKLKLYSIHGPQAERLLKTAVPHETMPEALLDHITTKINGATIHAARINLTGEVDFGIVCSKNDVQVVRVALERIGTAIGLVEIHMPALEIMRITAGIPRYGVDFDESNNPLEANLAHAVSFTKGCFPGQEILARLDSRGGASKKLCGLTLKGETIPKKNDKIIKEDLEVGQITSAAFSPTLKKVVALGYLKKECWTVGCSVMVETDRGRLPARVEPLPFYSPNSM